MAFNEVIVLDANLTKPAEIDKDGKELPAAPV
jgi:hypothetical protein